MSGAPGPTAFDLIRDGYEKHRLGRPAEAAPFYRKAASLKPDAGDAWHLLGLAASSRSDGSVLVYRAMASDPAQADFVKNQLRLLDRLRRYERASALAERASLLWAGDTDLDGWKTALRPKAAFDDAIGRLASHMPSSKRTLLHVGCGPLSIAHTHPAFAANRWSETRLDIDPSMKPDVVASMSDMGALAAGSMGALWSNHNLEHLEAHEVPPALAEFSRVLDPEGFAVISVPDLQAVAKLVAEDRLEEPAYMSGAGPISALDMMYGHGAAIAAGRKPMAHRTGFTEKTLLRHLHAAGFAVRSMLRADFNLRVLVTHGSEPR